MMDIGQPDQKRLRLAPWELPVDRHLPPPPQQSMTPYTSLVASYSRSDPQLTHRERERRSSDLTSHYEAQEMRRPSSGSQNFHTLSHGPSPFVLSRDSIIKRDTQDDLQYRHSSNGMITDTINVPSHHDSVNRMSQAVPNYETPRSQPFSQVSFPGTTVSIPDSFSQVYGITSSLPLPPNKTTEQFAKLPCSGARPPDQQVRKKAQRASQACDSCRTAKAKCDEGRPCCGSCKENGKECHYRDPPPKQQDKASADIMESLSRLEIVMQKFAQQMNDLTQEVNEIKKAQLNQISHMSCLSAHLKEEEDEGHSNILRYTYAGSLTGLESHHRPSTSSVNPLNSNEQIGIYQMSNRKVGDIISMSDDEDDVAVEPGPPKQPSIPVNHTTGAARLLLVPPIKKMCADILLSSKFKSEKYPYMQEWKRGLLRLYGRGEGNELLAGYDKDLMTDFNVTTPIDGHYDVTKPITGSEWGQIGLPLPSYLTCGNTESLPDFSRETVLELVTSYKNNINNLHPILTPKQLDNLAETFLRSIHDPRVRPKQTPASSFSATHNNPESPGNKRKRSPAPVDYSENYYVSEHKPGHPSRCISTAVVLLCMALGRICQDKGKIPQLPSDQELGSSLNTSFRTSPNMRNSIPLSPLHHTSFSASFSLNPTSNNDRLMGRGHGISVDTSKSERPLSRLRNTDVIPGLIYFALATDILGNQMAGSSLQHVHANILAGLYHAQLARIMESAAYISNACRALQVILRPRLHFFRKAKAEHIIVEAKDNPLIFAFWTCLQLESDIVAEIPCPQTGILTFEEDMPGPNLQAAHHNDGFEQNVIESYSAQLFLRKHLNSLHSMFYKPRDPNSEDKFTALVLANNKIDKPKFPSIELVSESLDGIDVYAPNMKWMVDQKDPPNDILGARLRAKYYGARVITYRPFVIQILERSEPPCLEAAQKTTEQISEEYLSEVKAPIVKHDIKDVKDIDPKALEYVRLGLKALINSTTAFYGLGHPGEKRIVVTNVWGTAHAQWGNVLTLQAAYMNPILNPLLLEQITKEQLIVLVEKTMGFLALVGSPSSALAIDWKILDLTSRKNGLRSQSTLGLTHFPSIPLGDLKPLRY